MSDPFDFRSDDPVELDVTVVRATDKALLCRVEDGSEVWLPKSQLLDGTEVEDEADEGAAVIPEWLAEEKGLA